MEAMELNRMLSRLARYIYQKLPVSKRFKQQYLAPAIFRLSGRYFRKSGAYQGWVIERNVPLFDRLADQYYQRAVSTPLPGTLPAISGEDSSSPEVSIIVLSHQRSEYTLACLQAVREHTTGHSYEMLVLDNGSAPEHSERIRKHAGSARLVRSDRNLGFGNGCNLAVTHAHGNYLLFLNNDALVTAGWLTALLLAMKTLPRAGIVGPKIVYADGTLQEAGADVLPDGHVVQRGKADDSRNSMYNRAEPVSYCSGASMLVRRDVFEAAEGFDEGYAPAYYEDVDLCYKFRKLGYDTYYCPEAMVIHREGGTSLDVWGTDGVTALIERNRKRFLDKWQAELQPDSHPVKMAGETLRIRKGTAHG